MMNLGRTTFVLSGLLLWAAALLPAFTPEQKDWGLPGSIRGQRAAQLLDALDSGSEEDLKRFIGSSVSDGLRQRKGEKGLLEFLSRLHRDLRSFEIAGIRAVGSGQAMLILHSKENPLEFRIDLTLEQGGEQRIDGLGVDVDESRSGPQEPMQSYEAVDTWLRGRAEEGIFSGVVLVAPSGEIAFQKAYGEASRRYHVPNRVDTRFNIGSINKIFTGVAILQLVQQGKVKLDAPLGRYLDGFPEDVAQSVTIRHLLQHRSGWGAYWENPDYLSNWSNLRSVEDYLEFIRRIPLDFEPGTDEAYSNTGYEVLGGIVEKASGMDYYDYIRRNVYDPAEMTGSGSFAMDDPVENLATGYTRQGAEPGAAGASKENTFFHSIKGTPAGGGYSTAQDLLRFMLALLDGKLLDPAHTAMMFNRFEPADGVPDNGAIGWGGGAPGINAVIELQFPRDIVIVLANLDPPAASETGRRIARSLPHLRK